MKDNNVDDLFRNGLRSHKITPPSAAWDKIESQLPAKSKKGIYFWISIAASITLVFTFGWIILSDSQSPQPVDTNLQAKKADTQVEDTLAHVPEKTPDIAEPTTPNEQLVAQSPVKVSTPAELKTEPSEALNSSVLTDLDKLQANVESNDEPIEERLPIELIRIDTKMLPISYNANEIWDSSFEMDLSISIESYISSYQILTLAPTKKKKFSLLSGIVNVAKGVNSGKLALSEMRKSKNDFFNNDLKYGSKEGDPEETKGDIDEN